MANRMVAIFFLASAVACLIASLYIEVQVRRPPAAIPSRPLRLRFDPITGFHLAPAAARP
jgi:hypothetical protein